MIANVSDRLNNTSTHNHSTNNLTQKTTYIQKASDILISKLRQSLTQLEQSIMSYLHKKKHLKQKAKEEVSHCFTDVGWHTEIKFQISHQYISLTNWIQGLYCKLLTCIYKSQWKTQVFITYSQTRDTSLVKYLVNLCVQIEWKILIQTNFWILQAIQWNMVC